MHYEVEFLALLKFAFTLLLHVSGLILPNIKQQCWTESVRWRWGIDLKEAIMWLFSSELQINVHAVELVIKGVWVVVRKSGRVWWRSNRTRVLLKPEAASSQNPSQMLEAKGLQSTLRNPHSNTCCCNPCMMWGYSYLIITPVSNHKGFPMPVTMPCTAFNSQVCNYKHNIHASLQTLC